MTISPLAPEHFPDLPTIAGIGLATAASGMRYQGRDDLLLITLASGSTVAGVFTQSDTAAAPVIWSRKVADTGKAAAIITNAGNANAFTGSRGDKAVREMVSSLANHLDCKAEAIMVASTGVIGEPLDTAALLPYFAALVNDANIQGVNASWHDAANAIRTTDTFAKGAHASCIIDGVAITICGIAKGSGMIAPNMATMLGYIGTDAALPSDVLGRCLRRANGDSFNSITVDSDTSTNDSVFLIASGKAGNRPVADADDLALKDFRKALAAVMNDLAIQIVRDGEGATKLVTIDITGAKDKTTARKIGLAIANSPLVKTAIAGEDANWGRIVMAIGKLGIGIPSDAISIDIGGCRVARDGMRVAEYDEAPIAAHMTGQMIDLAVSIGDGLGAARVWTCDLTHGYISINADYRS
ncbi:MAG: bifunctional glutamate N-acetyltransferase/amino-acid acetyltransferase ArgJ [Candidatus Puniceispirillum sp.]|nr:bifunctional glutamate N-acetyltransferase/amino-acid acetyltransferase ArgJ [Candidatus Puniceispirillum sp.]MBL6774122.1 bifunctional glutamate N-acetyltransferase/amino-acid acetyltransferase ArgJ [Candidatus Puniceispirillum sp.]